MSSKKFFNLLYGDKVHLAPQNKVVPSSEISALLSAQEIIETAKKEAERYRLEVAKECEILKEEAQRAGFEAGFAKWAELNAALEAEIAMVHKAMEKTVIPVALKAARKILGREIELSENAITDIVSTKVKAVSQHKRVTIYVNKNDLVKLEKNREHLKNLFENLESLSLRPREDVAVGGCVIETEAGIINAQLDHQWEIIERAFQNVLK